MSEKLEYEDFLESGAYVKKLEETYNRYLDIRDKKLVEFMKKNKQLKSQLQQKENIINELEKFLNELKINTENDIKYARSKNDDEEIIRLNREFNMTDMALVKLQKLKGSNKE